MAMAMDWPMACTLAGAVRVVDGLISVISRARLNILYFIHATIYKSDTAAVTNTLYR
jgi:hypothetical protein